jgi:hypothetical protein
VAGLNGAFFGASVLIAGTIPLLRHGIRVLVSEELAGEIGC